MATRLSYRNKSFEGDHFESFIKGIETVLIEGHIPHDFIADDQISKERLKQYKLIILPNVRCLSDKEVSLLTDYVGEGGPILATYETSLYHRDGVKRNDFGLAEIFGCRFTGNKINTRKDCYQFIASPEHPVVKPDSSETELLINAGHTLLCNATSEAKKICTYVPVVHNQPPEKAWSNEWSREFPTVLENAFKKGKVIYFANQPDLVTQELGHPDMRNLLLRSVRYLAGDSISVETNAPESVHVGLTRSRQASGEYIFSLVNTTSAPVRPLRRLIPVHDIQVKLRLAGKFSNYKVLRSQGDCQVSFKSERVEIQLNKLEDFFAIHLVMIP